MTLIELQSTNCLYKSLNGLGIVVLMKDEAGEATDEAGLIFLSGSATLWLFMCALRDLTLVNTLKIRTINC